MVVTKRVTVPRTPAVRGVRDIYIETRRERDRDIPSSRASLIAAASSVLSSGSHPPFGTVHFQLTIATIRTTIKYSLNQLPFRFLEVMTNTLPAFLAMGIAQQTTRGLTASFLPIGPVHFFVNF